MRVLKFISFWVLLVILVLCAFCFTKIVFAKGYGGEFIGAFFGAFFAAVSVILYEMFLKYRDKEVERVNQLIVYELQLNNCMRILSELTFQINKRSEETDTEKVVIIHHISLEPLVLAFEPITSIRHIGIKNELFSLHADLSKINTDSQNLMLVYKSNVQMITSSSEDKLAKIKQLSILNDELKKQLKYFSGFINETQEEIINCVAGIRILIKWDKPSLPKHIYRYFTGWEYDDKNYQKELKEEKEKLLGEINETQKRSGIKINKAKGEVFEA